MEYVRIQDDVDALTAPKKLKKEHIDNISNFLSNLSREQGLNPEQVTEVSKYIELLRYEGSEHMQDLLDFLENIADRDNWLKIPQLEIINRLLNNDDNQVDDVIESLRELLVEQDKPSNVIPSGLDRDVQNSAIDYKSREITQEAITEYIVRELQNVELVDLPEALQELKDSIIFRYKNARAEDGYTCGYTAAQSISSAIMQAAMDSFRDINAAASMTGGTLKDLTILLYAVKKRGDGNRMVVHFNKRMSMQDIIDMRPVFVETRLPDLIKRSEIRKIAPIGDNDRIGRHPRYRWHNSFSLYHGGLEIPEESHVLRFLMNYKLMFERQITMEMVYDALVSFGDGKYWVVTSPIEHRIVDIIVNEKAVLKQRNVSSHERESDIIHEFLREDLYPKLNDIIFGIEGIKGITPQSIRMDKVFQDSPVRIREYVWKLVVNRDNENTKRACFSCFKEIEEVFESIGMKYDAKRTILDDIADTGIVRHYEVDVSSVRWVTEQTRRTKNPLYILNLLANRDKIDLNYWFMVTTGTNYKEILKDPWVDPDRTVSNNIHKICSYLGCEASRKYFMYEISSVLTNVGCGEINPRHVSLSADVIYYMGDPLGLNVIGCEKRGQNNVQLMTNQRGAKFAADGALNKEVSYTINPPTSILVGAKPIVSTEDIRTMKPTADIERVKAKYAETGPKAEIDYVRQGINDFMASIMDKVADTRRQQPTYTYTEKVYGDLDGLEGRMIPKREAIKSESVVQYRESRTRKTPPETLELPPETLKLSEIKNIYDNEIIEETNKIFSDDVLGLLDADLALRSEEDYKFKIVEVADKSPFAEILSMISEIKAPKTDISYLSGFGYGPSSASTLNRTYLKPSVVLTYPTFQRYDARVDIRKVFEFMGL